MLVDHHVNMGTILKLLDGSLHLFEELCRVYCDRDGKQVAAIVCWSPLWAV